jgi:ParB/RepB/Spo0J family partition protein
MKLSTMNPNKLKADKNQPRKVPSGLEQSEEFLQLVSSIKQHGIINPIEVDEKGVIVTGELRWRASKKAGLKEIDVRVLTDKEIKNRFGRQAHENNVRSGLDFSDMMLATKWALKETGGSQNAASKLLGVSKATLDEYSQHIQDPKEITESIAAGGTPRTAIRSTHGASKKHRLELQRAVLKHPEWTRDEVKAKASVLTDKVSKEAARQIIEQPVANWTDALNSVMSKESSFSKKCLEFVTYLNSHPRSSFPKATSKSVSASVGLAEGAIKEWRRS